VAGIADFRLPIADCRWTLEGVGTPLFRSSIANQQSVMKTWSFGCGYAALYSIPLNSH
jgi:hypothetical protein